MNATLRQLAIAISVCIAASLFGLHAPALAQDAGNSRDDAQMKSERGLTKHDGKEFGESPEAADDMPDRPSHRPCKEGDPAPNVDPRASAIPESPERRCPPEKK